MFQKGGSCSGPEHTEERGGESGGFHGSGGRSFSFWGLRHFFASPACKSALNRGCGRRHGCGSGIWVYQKAGCEAADAAVHGGSGGRRHNRRDQAARQGACGGADEEGGFGKDGRRKS